MLAELDLNPAGLGGFVQQGRRRAQKAAGSGSLRAVFQGAAAAIVAAAVYDQNAFARVHEVSQRLFGSSKNLSKALLRIAMMEEGLKLSPAHVLCSRILSSLIAS